jgi:hypothetical protein
MRFPNLPAFSLLLLICLLLAGCQLASTPSPAPTFPAPNLALDGTWTGKTDQDQVVLFEISNSKLTQFKLNYAFDTCTKTVFNMSATVPGAGRFIDERTLSIAVPQLLNISFMSDSFAQGTFDFDTSQGILAASCQPGLKQNITFTAAKQVKQTPSP